MRFFRLVAFAVGFIIPLTPLGSPTLRADEGTFRLPIVSAPEVKKRMEEGQTLLIHALSHIEFRIQHIPGSINIPANLVAKSDLMPRDKNKRLIVYCNGVKCPYSRRAAKIAVSMGYTNVKWFRGGIGEWRKFRYPMVVDKELLKIKVRKLSPTKLKRLMTDEKAFILDVRPKWWRDVKQVPVGMIQGTDITIPLLELGKRLTELPRDRTLVLTDRIMRQSVHAAKFLVSKGFKIGGVLKGGAKRWETEGLPMQPDTSP